MADDNEFSEETCITRYATHAGECERHESAALSLNRQYITARTKAALYLVVAATGSLGHLITKPAYFKGIHNKNIGGKSSIEAFQALAVELKKNDAKSATLKCIQGMIDDVKSVGRGTTDGRVSRRVLQVTNNAASLLTSCIRYAQMLDKARPKQSRTMLVLTIVLKAVDRVTATPNTAESKYLKSSPKSEQSIANQIFLEIQGHVEQELLDRLCLPGSDATVLDAVQLRRCLGCNRITEPKLFDRQPKEQSNCHGNGTLHKSRAKAVAVQERAGPDVTPPEPKAGKQRSKQSFVTPSKRAPISYNQSSDAKPATLPSAPATQISPSGNPAAEDQDALTTPNQIVSKTEDTSIVVAILGQSPAVSNTYLEPLFVRGPAKLSIVYEGEGYEPIYLPVGAAAHSSLPSCSHLFDAALKLRGKRDWRSYLPGDQLATVDMQTDCLVTFSTSQPLSVRVHSSTERPKFLVDEATSELNRLGKDMRLQATLELLPWLAPHGIDADGRLDIRTFIEAWGRRSTSQQGLPTFVLALRELVDEQQAVILALPVLHHLNRDRPHLHRATRGYFHSADSTELLGRLKRYFEQDIDISVARASEMVSTWSQEMFEKRRLRFGSKAFRSPLGPFYQTKELAAILVERCPYRSSSLHYAIFVAEIGIQALSLATLWPYTVAKEYYDNIPLPDELRALPTP